MEAGVEVADGGEKGGEALGEVGGLGAEGLAEFVGALGGLLEFLVVVRALASKAGDLLEEGEQFGGGEVSAGGIGFGPGDVEPSGGADAAEGDACGTGGEFAFGNIQGLGQLVFEVHIGHAEVADGGGEFEGLVHEGEEEVLDVVVGDAEGGWLGFHVSDLEEVFVEVEAGRQRGVGALVEVEEERVEGAHDGVEFASHSGGVGLGYDCREAWFALRTEGW